MTLVLPSIALHAKSHGITPQKRLGQNFIFDSSLCDKILRSALPSANGKDILEIGPGPGGLTRAILSQNPRRLIVIEKDPRCLELLLDLQKYYPNLEIISGDALEIDLKDLAIKKAIDKIVIISNLPYNVGTELLFKWLEYPEIVESMTLMLQREVVDRICANHSTKAYGKLSVICQLLADVNKEFDVSPKAFYPPPKVHSSIINIRPKNILHDKILIEKVRKITHTAFMFRRKMLKKALSEIPEQIFLDLNIDNNDRPENLSPEQYLSLAKELL